MPKLPVMRKSLAGWRQRRSPSHDLGKRAAGCKPDWLRKCGLPHVSEVLCRTKSVYKGFIKGVFNTMRPVLCRAAYVVCLNSALCCMATCYVLYVTSYHGICQGICRTCYSHLLEPNRDRAGAGIPPCCTRSCSPRLVPTRPVP